MHRIDGPAAAPGGVFSEGDPNVGTPATVVTDDWMNAVQTEIENVIVGSGAALSKPDNTQLLAAVRVLIGRAVPPGAIQPFAMATVPGGWLKCNGQALGRSAYPALFAAIGVDYGAGDGGSTFNLPDLRGEFVRGWDDGRGVDPGRTLGSQQADSLKAHTHVESAGPYPTHGFIAGGGDAFSASQSPSSTGSTGGPETRPRNVAAMWCIKA